MPCLLLMPLERFLVPLLFICEFYTQSLSTKEQWWFTPTFTHVTPSWQTKTPDLTKHKPHATTSWQEKSTFLSFLICGRRMLYACLMCCVACPQSPCLLVGAMWPSGESLVYLALTADLCKADSAWGYGLLFPAVAAATVAHWQQALH